MSKTNYPLVKVDWEEIENLSFKIAEQILLDKKQIDLIVPILRGGMPIAMLLSSMLNVEDMSCIHIRRSVNDEPNTWFNISLTATFVSSSSLYIRGFTISIYQSQNSFQINPYILSNATPKS